MVESAAFPGGYYRNTFEAAPDESEGSGSSAQIDTEVTASDNSSTPARKCVKLSPDDEDPYGVQRQVISLYNMSQSERKDLIHRLKLELEQTKIVLKNAELQRLNTPSVSSTSARMGFNSSQKPSSRVSSSKRPSDFAMGPGKNVRHQPGAASRGWNRGSSGKFESSSKESIPSASNVILMKQCDTLLKKLWSHPHSWVFQAPVDVVKLNIPDYLTIIKHPMDLGTIKKNLASGVYSSPHEFAADVRLTFTNAMTYNPPGHDVHIMGDILSKLFEARWKAIEKKLPVTLPAITVEPREEKRAAVFVPPAKKRKMASSPVRESVPEPVKALVMTAEERHRLGRQLESLLEELPAQIIDFLKKHSSNGGEIAEDEIEIDIDVLSDEVLFSLKKLLDEHIQDKEAKQSNVEPCEIELPKGSGPSSSLLQRGNEMADEYVGGNEPPISRSSSDSESGSSEDQSDDAKPIIQEGGSKIPETTNSEAQRDEDTRIDDLLNGSESNGAPEQMDISTQQKPSSDETDGQPDGEMQRNTLENPVSSEKKYRAALLKNKFADIILKAREKTLPQQNSNKGDPEKLRKEREELELKKKKERARLQAEAEAAENARRQAEAEAAAEAAAESKRQREVEREAARQALLKMEKTVEINENSRFLEDLEMLRSSVPEQLLSSVDEISPERTLDALGSFNLGGMNPLEQLGLYMKQDDDEDEPEAPPTVPKLATDVEEGEID
ncbi:hypothetical protein YC2023_074062 [Brassica napus]